MAGPAHRPAAPGGRTAGATQMATERHECTRFPVRGKSEDVNLRPGKGAIQMKRFRLSMILPLFCTVALLAGAQPATLAAGATAGGGVAAAPKPPMGAAPDSGTVVVTPANMAGWRWM